MMKPISIFAQKYIPISDAENDFISSNCLEKSAKKYQHLYEEGDICNEFIIITKGITRVYLVDASGKEVTVWFGFGNSLGSDIQSFISGEPTKFFVQAIDDLEYVSISKNDFLNISNTVPLWHKFQAKLWSECIVQIIDRLIGYQYQNAEERYEILQTNEKYVQLIPQKYLASFLGITHTSLSRLRKQIYAKKHSVV